MAICKFFQQGNCRKGSNCDFEHIKGGQGQIGQISRDNLFDSNASVINSGRRKSKRKQSQIVQQATNDHVVKAQKKESPVKKKNNRSSNKGRGGKGKESYKKYQNPQSTTVISNNNINPRVPGIKDYVDMIISDLSCRPFMWHFSSYGLTLNSTQSLPFPFFGCTELSAEELRLQVYAEAAATGGRIENYVKVVGEIRERAERTTKALIPNLEGCVSELLRVNNVSIGNGSSVSSGITSLQKHQETLRQTLQSRSQQPQPPQQQSYESLLAQNQSYDSLLSSHYQHQPLQHQQHHHHQQQSSFSTDAIIPDDAFSFGFIPEIPPE